MAVDIDKKLRLVKDAVRSYPDFPQPGITFRDIFGIFYNVEALQAMKDLIINHTLNLEVDLVVGIDSRGFLFGPMIAMDLKKPFLPIRKKGKLPGKVIEKSYTLEYGQATIEVQKEYVKKGLRILLVDDLLATGGSMSAAVGLLESLGAEIVECFVVMELKGLKGREKLAVPVYSLLQFD